MALRGGCGRSPHLLSMYGASTITVGPTSAVATCSTETPDTDARDIQPAMPPLHRRPQAIPRLGSVAGDAHNLHRDTTPIHAACSVMLPCLHINATPLQACRGMYVSRATCLEYGLEFTKSTIIVSGAIS